MPVVTIVGEFVITTREVEEGQLVAGSTSVAIPVEVASLRGDAQKVLDYFKQIYGENTAIMARLQQLLQQAA